jgi:DNA invertase Pin-like site-specific DNA recombinase
MLIGYARVSKTEQHLELQLDALAKAECEQIYTDKITGSKTERKGLEDALSHLRKGDTLVVWRLDRLGRSLKHLIDTLPGFHEKGIEFKSLTENIDTSTISPLSFYSMFTLLGEG